MWGRGPWRRVDSKSNHHWRVPIILTRKIILRPHEARGKRHDLSFGGRRVCHLSEMQTIRTMTTNGRRRGVSCTYPIIAHNNILSRYIGRRSAMILLVYVFRERAMVVPISNRLVENTTWRGWRRLEK